MSFFVPAAALSQVELESSPPVGIPGQTVPWSFLMLHVQVKRSAATASAQAPLAETIYDTTSENETELETWLQSVAWKGGSSDMSGASTL